MYVEEEEFIKIFGEKELISLTGRGSGKSDSDVYEAATERADGLIDDYLRAFYVVPFTTIVPRTIVNIASAITRYELYSLKPRESVTDLYNEAINMLERIITGKLDLTGVTKLASTSRNSSSRLRRV